MTSSTFRPPQEMLNNIVRGEDLKKRWSRGGNGTIDAVYSAIEGAGAGLAKGDALSLGAVKELKKFFAAHPDSYDPTKLEKSGGPNEATINWLLCGGTAGKEWADKVLEKHAEPDSFKTNQNFLKVDDSLGLVLGFAIVCKKDGKEYYDVQGDHIPEDAMMKASVDFMQSNRTVGDMHSSEEGGQVVFAFPLTADVAKAFNLTTSTTGLMIAIKPQDQKTLEKFRNGTYNGFSIGGIRITDEEVANG